MENERAFTGINPHIVILHRHVGIDGLEHRILTAGTRTKSIGNVRLRKLLQLNRIGTALLHKAEIAGRLLRLNKVGEVFTIAPMRSHIILIVIGIECQGDGVE